MPVLVRGVVCLRVCLFFVVFHFLCLGSLVCRGLGSLHLGCALYSRAECSCSFAFVEWLFLADRCSVLFSLRTVEGQKVSFFFAQTRASPALALCLASADSSLGVQRTSARWGRFRLEKAMRSSDE